MNRITETAPQPVQSGWKRGDPIDALLTREWIVTNALGGYASGSVGGACTRRFHGHLIAALRSPLGRTMMLNHLEEVVEGDGICYRLSGDEHGQGKEIGYPERDFLEEFVLESGLPLWRFSKNGIRIEKRVLMPYLQNTTYIAYRLIDGPRGLKLRVRPSLHFRPHEGLLTARIPETWDVRTTAPREIEIADGRDFPPLKLFLFGANAHLRNDVRTFEHVLYRVEKSRGYEYEGPLWSPGVVEANLEPGTDCGIVASVETWDVVRALEFRGALDSAIERHQRLLSIAHIDPSRTAAAQLVLASDQFLIHPHARAADEARVRAAGDEPRTVIAGYHWFTDWGRDTMISLEGLTLCTGRHREAGNILRTFSSYIKDGLIPNLFPEGGHGGLYHTADATMWFFHAVWRYLQSTNDEETVTGLVPKLVDIIDHHIRGTDFNIHVDPKDGLLSQGAEGYQLTWMDAKVDGWVVTPRRGKAVEINALYYNALRILEQLLLTQDNAIEARRMNEYAERARESFNKRFWYEDGQYLYDVVDPNDSALRPNQIFSVSLDFPVLEQSRWPRVVEVVEDALLTPYGLRTLSRDHPDYKKAYDGDLRARDAAYHQGTVWPWLIGPFIDAWLKVHDDDRKSAQRFLDGFKPHLADACIGTISEIFDAEPPYHPRGCAAQAWSVAEVLRCLYKLRG
ncbi:MAG TPA: amylo-alpha-1,6-glucosidase [Thermoanaerobaculia bacterium]|nr:amylo-alpha-1,6-glucosidase [Thermoanaerobaculia bacterium]